MSKVNKKSKTFIWKGKSNTKANMEGEIVSDSIEVAKLELRNQGITVKKISQKSTLFQFGAAKIRPLDIALFTRQLATMLKAGVPIIQAFDITVKGLENLALRDLLIQVKSDISSGTTLADSLRKHPEYFDSLYCNLVASGEQSGSLETLLDRIATYKEKTEALKNKIKKAMNYPIAVVVVAGIVTAILLLKVVPQFEEIFNGFGAKLPTFTQVVIDLSRFLQESWLMVLAGGIGFYMVMKLYIKTPNGQEQKDRLVLKLPVVGNILHKSAVARFARTLSTTFSAGVPLVNALGFVSRAAGNIVYSNAISEITEAVTSGQQLQSAMQSVGVFPSMSVQMVSIGEESGSLDVMLDKVASYYEDEVDNTVDGLTSMLEPIIMSVLGVLVGGLIIAMYLPIFQMGSVV